MTEPEGLAVVDTEEGLTSHDVVAKARGIFGTRKVGHAGTLDPDATGVLLLGVGRATRLMRFLSPLLKQYEGELVLGAETTTLDASGEITSVYDMSAVTPGQVCDAASGFVGDIMQIPPMVSAIRVGGRRLYEMAREGVEVEREARPVTVYDLTVAPVDAGSGVYRMRVRCSSGTYIRSLAADIGSALGGGAHLRALRRLAVGSFSVAEARPIQAASVMPMAEALRDYAAVSVGEDLARRVGSGQMLSVEELAVEGEGPWAVLGPEGQLLAVYEPHPSGLLKPAVVIPR